jgi:glyoxylase-like metal-dependent hydrolase (beta-lactamase superfamily II)
MNPADLLRERIQLTVFADDLFAENCYVLERRDSNKAIVIDPGLQYREVLDLIERRGISVERILITHGHFDHVAGVPGLKAATQAGVAMHPNDLAILDFKQFSELSFLPVDFASFTPDEDLTNGQRFDFQDLRLTVLHTPGHTQGSVCFVIGLDCFSGDTLFERGIGRTDLPGGDTQKLFASIREVLYGLPPETIVYPGHGPTTTIRAEMLLNPFVPAGE